ncbi:MAG: glycerol dehydrogenase [Lentisphaerae bacterium RIFOXYB12_FULL_65_16]|nr:MAG: glycerol dehydrogenase [Lentisphaerae bacterium RIFOXYA12_64_32]OGV89866.1 MAG: glycerol dehydrogenase [Lentisphaerae bacterium RIFOXYB12_FULL_65_16]
MAADKQRFRKAVFPGLYLQGEGALMKVPELMESFGGAGMVICAPSSFDTVLPGISQALPKGSVVERFGRECCEKELGRLAALVAERGARVVVAVGGGKAIDTAKIVADRGHLPVIIVPTIASTDAPCSGCAIIYSEHGVFEKVSYQRRNPDAVVVDTGIIAKAPVRFLVSGMGDALATWFEAHSCERTASTNECGGLSTITALGLARLCFDTLLGYGVAAKHACEEGVVTPALERIVEANTLLSGLGFESSGLAAAHSIHNGLTALPPTHKYYHGEKVAIGTLAGLHLTDADPDDVETAYGFCEDVGLPTTLAEIGLAGVSREDLMKAAQHACAPQEGIHHEAGIITPARVVAALLAADRMGRERTMV